MSRARIQNTRWHIYVALLRGTAMNEVLTVAEIKSRYDSEWVLIEDPQTNEALEVQSGRVLYHSRDRDEFDRKALGFHPKRFAVLYTGNPPEGMEFAL